MLASHFPVLHNHEPQPDMDFMEEGTAEENDSNPELAKVFQPSDNHIQWWRISGHIAAISGVANIISIRCQLPEYCNNLEN